MRRTISLLTLTGCLVAGGTMHLGCSSNVDVASTASGGTGGAGTTAAGTGGEADAATTAGSGGAGSSSTTTASSATSSGAGGAAAHGECTSDADCAGGQCVELTPGGYEVCTSMPDEATSCQMAGEPDQCCTTADCPAGAGCYAASDIQFCGGAYPAFNECIADECQTDSDCPQPAICAPAGAFGHPKRACLVAYCHTDADCNEKPGGACLLVGGNPCCSHPAPDGLACVYPGGCSSDAQCPDGACDIDPKKGVGTCGPAGPGCPP